MSVCHNCGSYIRQEPASRDWDATCYFCDRIWWIAEGETLDVCVSKILSLGVFVNLGDGVLGLIHIVELDVDRVDHPSEVVSIGDYVKAIVLRIDSRERKIGLSLKRVRESYPGGQP